MAASHKPLFSWDFHAQQSQEYRKKKQKKTQFCGWKRLVIERGLRRMTRAFQADRTGGPHYLKRSSVTRMQRRHTEDVEWTTAVWDTACSNPKQRTCNQLNRLNRNGKYSTHFFIFYRTFHIYIFSFLFFYFVYNKKNDLYTDSWGGDEVNTGTG